MHLKTLTLAGFKSFADRTRIECEPGVTVVVGPNGSGKSNIVDAIAWVMGTQATSTLRTERMEDVIFAGTATRPALGRAEVALTLDNTSGDLALDLPEVTISRRLFRDGTSEYEINGTSCRLLDVQELLADSGVGRHQHVLVGQGRVDEVLNAGPDEHRAVIEEAAGVIKHRLRRDRSIRRLEATDVDISRLNDLLTEQQRLMKPLRRQARAAERHDTVKAEWRALRLWVGGEQLRTARDRLSVVEADVQVLQQDVDAAASERDALADQLRDLQSAAGKAGEALDRDAAALARLETTAERMQSIALVARERRLGVERSIEGTTERRADLDAERLRLAEQIEQARAEEAAAAERADRLAVTLQALDDEERSLADVERLPVDGALASLQGDLAALEAAAVRDERESADLTRRRGAVAAVIVEEVAETERIGTARVAAVADQEREEKELTTAAQTAARDADGLQRAQDAYASAEREVAAANGRVEALEAARAGILDVEARQAAEGESAIVGTILARLDVPADWRDAVAAALGPWATGFAASDRAGIASVTSALRRAGLGGVAVAAPVAGASVSARRASSGRALVDLLGPAADHSLAETLLGDVVVVNSLEAAFGLVEAEPSLRALTEGGDVVSAAGAVIAEPEGRAEQLIEEARDRLHSAERERARCASRVATATRERDSSARVEAAAREAHDAARRRVQSIDETVSLLERSRSGRQAELDRLDARARTLAEAAATRTDRMEGVRRRLVEMEGGSTSGAELIDLSSRREHLARRRDETSRRHQEALAAAAAASERRDLTERRSTELATLFDSIGSPEEASRLSELRLVEETAQRARQIIVNHVTLLRRRLDTLKTDAGDAGLRLDRARTRRDELGDSIAAKRDRLSDLAVEKAELLVRLESIAEGLRRDVDAGEDEALVAPRPELDTDAEPEDHLATLEARLKRLGPVNPLAAAEYRELEERSSFLEAQLVDLEESRDELRKVIEALDDEIGRLFQEAFGAIAGHFEENFSLLFPGGTGTIKLSDPDDPLATGVDIYAQPMGKKVDRLQLLSGGERSLAALAFLFAVFRARPSPFYVLDEVEAALDDANLRRFLRLVGTLRDTSQLVIVTHQQQTMEAADVLYGVTMEPGETSRVLAKRMSELVDTA